MNRPTGILGQYRDTWQQTGTGGQAILVGTFAFVTRIVGFSFLLPLYVKASGYSTEQYGILFAMLNIVPVIALVPILWLARRGWDRRLMMMGPALGLIGLAGLILARDARFEFWMLAIIPVGGSSATYWTLSDPLLAEATLPAIRARTYALKWILFTLGSSFGALTAGVIPDVYRWATDASDRNAYWIMLFGLALLDIIQIRVFRNVPVRNMTARAPGTGKRGGSVRTIGVTLVLFGVAEALFGLGYSTIRPFMSLFLTEGQGLSSGAAGAILASTAISAASGAMMMPILAQRIGNTAALACLRLLGAIAVAGWFVLGDLPSVIALTFLYYGFMDGTSALYAAEIMGRLPASVRDLMAGINNVLWSLVAAVAAALSGFLQDYSDGAFGLAFSVGIVGYVLSALWCWKALPRIRVEQLDGGVPPTGHTVQAANYS